VSNRSHFHFVDLSPDIEAAFVTSARDAGPVKGLTHGYYKYPARFSPRFVRAALEAFTAPGDFCIDPHVGGGTTLVEALALGRNALGIDISALAEFVSAVKTTVFSVADLQSLGRWAGGILQAIDIRKPSAEITGYAELGYYKHLSHPVRWRIRKAIEQAIRSAMALEDAKLEAFGRCVVLRAAQWALDGRKAVPSLKEFRKTLHEMALDMIEGATALRCAVSVGNFEQARVEVLNRSAAGIETDLRLADRPAPRLVLTSPPYPGVHVLYHRWQVDGRKEAPLPFMIANKLDGAGSSYYTMGDRKFPGLKTYFDNIRATMSSVAALADDQTTIVQMVAFADREWQLPQYLKTMEEAGLEEIFLGTLKDNGDGRLWRSVPGRRWYSQQRGQTPGSNEVVLLHRRRRFGAAEQIKRPGLAAREAQLVL
jgi:DNA methylase